MIDDGGEAIRQFLKDMAEEQLAMRRLTTTLMWHMRGSMSRDEAWTLSPNERQDIIKLIEEHKELTEKTGMPLM